LKPADPEEPFALAQKDFNVLVNNPRAYRQLTQFYVDVGLSLAPELARLAAQLAAIEHFVDHQTASVVIHEAVHMLLHQHAILTASKENPIWLVEGLAGSFEPREATERFGPNRRENGRTQDFRRHLSEGRVPSIASLLEATTTPSDGLDRESFYDGSAVLCSWLVRNEPEGMAEYIRGRKWDRTSSNDAGGRAAFEAAFGAIDKLERRWLNAERSAAGLPRY
jgi:hypothetical protein